MATVKNSIVFKFMPLDMVWVRAYGLNYRGRVLGCHLGVNDMQSFNVEYAADGDIKTGFFRADELELLNG